MKLPDLSNMMHVGQMRYIQAHCESAEYRNPDAVVGSFLTIQQRLACIVRARFFMPRLRATPFYYYVLARTRYYDEVFLNAVYGSVACIINIGCGSDTRAYRFAHILKQKGVTVVECDQAQAIYNKQKIASNNFPTEHVNFMPLDLNDSEWPEFSRLLDEKCQRPVLVMMEGVSPYISSESFAAFLRLLASKLHAHSLLAYDFKIAGTLDDFGQSARARQPFRLPAIRKEVDAFHEPLGFRVERMELGADLSKRLLPDTVLQFDEDCLLQLSLRE